MRGTHGGFPLPDVVLRSARHYLAPDEIQECKKMAQYLVNDLPAHEAERIILQRAREMRAEAVKDTFRAVGRGLARLFARRNPGLAH